MKKVLLMMLGVLIALPGLSQIFTYEYEGQTLKYAVLNKNAKTCETMPGSYSGGVATPGNAVSGRVVIPSVVSDGTDEYTVTTIGSNGFPANPGLTEIVFPETLTYIGDYAFQDCSGLTSVFIPASVTGFGRNPFQRCRGLIKSLCPNTLGGDPFYDGVTIPYDPEDILFEDGWFYNKDKTTIICAPLTLEGEYTIPTGINTVGQYAFAGCNGLTSIDFGNVTTIGSYAFRDCSALPASLIIPPSVTSAGERIFSDSGVKKVAYPKSSGYNYLGCNWHIRYDSDDVLFEDGWIYNKDKTSIIYAPLTLEGDYTIPGGINTIGEGAFAGCSGLTSIDCGNVTTINENAFAGCSGLTSIDFGNVTTIKERAFHDCSGLTSVILPPSVKTVGRDLFEYCSELVKSAYPNNIGNPFYSYVVAVAYNPDGAIIEDGWIFGPEHASILFAPSTLEGEYTVPAGVTTIGGNAFSSCRGLTSVIISPSVKSIGKDAFSSCTGLVKSAYPENLANPFNSGLSIAYNSEGAIVENGLIFGSQHTSILFVPHTFEGEYTIPSSVNSIGKEAFRKCEMLTSVEIPASVLTVGESAFRACSSLANFKIADGDTTIEFKRDALVDTPVNNLYAGRNWTYEGTINSNGWFTSQVTLFPNVSSVTIGNQVTSIGECAFYNCKSLDEVIIPSSVRSIGNRAFDSCELLKKISIENGVTSIGSSAFCSCKSLEEIILPSSVLSIGDYAFAYCESLEDVIIPPSVTSIGEWTFDECNIIKGAYPKNLYLSFARLNIGYDPTDAVVENGFVYNTKKDILYYAPLRIEGEFKVPETVNKIGAGAFGLCEDMTSVVLPSSLASIGKMAFCYCNALTPVEFPSSLASIGEQAFCYCDALTSVEFPSSLAYIGENAFDGCENLKEVLSHSEIPPVMDNTSFSGLYDTAMLSVPDASVSRYIDTNWSLFKNLRLNDSSAEIKTYSDGVLAYRLIPDSDPDAAEPHNTAVVISGDYSSLTEVAIPERFTDTSDEANTDKPQRYYVTGIGYGAFRNCSNLKTITFNRRSTLEHIGEYAFASTGFSYIKLPATVETIGKNAFAGSSITKISVPEKVTEIADRTFYNCTSLTEVSLPAGLLTIGKAAFGYSAIKDIAVPDAVSTIGDDAFYDCSNLASAYIAPSVRTIGDYAFYNSITSGLTLNEGLVAVGEQAFAAYANRNLPAIYMPSTLKSVGSDAFLNRTVAKVNISDVAAWCGIDFADADANPLKSSTEKLFVNDEQVKSLVIPAGTPEIRPYAFYNCTTLESVEPDEELLSIGTQAFFDCTGIRELTIPCNVAEIGSRAFSTTNSYNNKLTALTFVDGTSPIEIADDAFRAPQSLVWGRPMECMNLATGSLRNLTIGNVAGEIPDAMFKGASYLNTLTLGSSITAIGNEAFRNCSLSEVVLPPSVETIGDYAFAGNTNLALITMGHKMASIGDNAFNGCKASTVSITAQTPPAAPNTAFSNYSGSLYVQGEDAADAYYDAYTCWDRFDSHIMIEAEELRVEGETTLNGKPGDSYQLTATLYPENVTLPYIFWRSTNPDVATVTPDGVVTLHVDLKQYMALAANDSEVATCKIIAESLYADGPVAEVTVNNDSSSVDIIVGGGSDDSNGNIDYNAPVEVYNLQGMKISDTIENLNHGVYIVRQGRAVEKIAVK